VAEGVAGLEEEEEEEEEVEDEGTLERWEMGEEVEGRGGRASVGRATAIGRGKTRKIAGHPSITALPPRTGLAPFFDIPFSPIFALRTSVFTFLSSDLSLFFCSQASNARFRPRGLECAPASARQRAALSVSKMHGTPGSIFQ